MSDRPPIQGSSAGSVYACSTRAWLRIVAENGSIVRALLCVGIMLGRGISSPLMQLYVLAMAFFAQFSLSFLLAKPWDHQRWLAHAIFAGGFLVLSYGVLKAFHRTRAFVLVYSQEEMKRRLEHANVALERLAATDALTGAANRRYFLKRFEEELARAERGGEPLSLLMMDIDLFKAVNDKCGHQAGDATLVAFVERTREILRASDLLGRLGGERSSPRSCRDRPRCRPPALPSESALPWSKPPWRSRTVRCALPSALAWPNSGSAEPPSSASPKPRTTGSTERRWKGAIASSVDWWQRRQFGAIEFLQHR
jgi:hypothetical protein